MSPRALITGGAGFIGTNMAAHLLRRGMEVVVLDDLSRRGTSHNLAWLQREFGARLRFVQADVARDCEPLKEAAADCDLLFHFAAQVAVTSSVEDPRRDFEVNALGTLNALEAARAGGRNPVFLYASTNKVYGELAHLEVREESDHYRLARAPQGIPEAQPLDFHSPYGCSKGAADQYVRDYARIYGLRTVVFRQSCIYGPHQFGIVDQGWLSHFIISILRGRALTIYGDGKQVRDVLHVDDLLRAFDLAVERIDRAAGQIYNVGGGPRLTLSLLQLLELLGELTGRRLECALAPARPGDQRVFICDVRKAQSELGWSPEISPRDGVRALYDWTRENLPLFEE